MKVIDEIKEEEAVCIRNDDGIEHTPCEWVFDCSWIKHGCEKCGARSEDEMSREDALLYWDEKQVATILE